jgi:hypothetical protein
LGCELGNLETVFAQKNSCGVGRRSAAAFAESCFDSIAIFLRWSLDGRRKSVG